MSGSRDELFLNREPILQTCGKVNWVLLLNWGCFTRGACQERGFPGRHHPRYRGLHCESRPPRWVMGPPDGPGPVDDLLGLDPWQARRGKPTGSCTACCILARGGQGRGDTGQEAGLGSSTPVSARSATSVSCLLNQTMAKGLLGLSASVLWLQTRTFWRFALNSPAPGPGSLSQAAQSLRTLWLRVGPELL